MADQELQVKFGADMHEWDSAIAKAKADLSLLDGYLRKSAQAHNLSARATKDDAVQQAQLVAALNGVKRGLNETNASLSKNATSLKANSDQAKSAAKDYDQTGMSLAGLAKGYLTVAAVMEAGRIFLDSTKEVTKYENQLKVASGTTEDYAKNTQFLEGLAAKYNKNVIDLGGNFAKLTIATKGTNLEGAKTERLFAAVTATSAALQMSVDDTNGTFNAFIQMVSKGNVQAEELRGQLGERLYGAFNLAAKSMGVTTQELNKMLEQGQVLSADLLPKLTVELENTLGKDAEANAHNLGSAIEYATGQLTLLIAEAGKSSGLTGFFTQAAQDAGGLLSQLRLLNREKGALSVVGGLFGSLLETGLNGTGYTSPSLDYARDQQSNHGYAPLIGNSLRLPGEMQPASNGQFPFAQNFNPGDATPVDAAAEEKLKKANEAAANKAAAAVNKWVSEQIQASKDRIAVQFAAIEAKNQPDYNFHGTLGAIGQAQPRGINTGLDNDLNKTQNFSSDTSGTEKSLKGLSYVIEEMNSLGPIDWHGKLAADKLKLANSDLAQEGLRTEEIGNQLGEGITNSLQNAAASTMQGVGAIAAGIAMGTADLSDVGNMFLGIMANLFESIGQALASAAAAFLIADIAIGTVNPVGAAAGAALAYAAAAIAKSQIADSGSQAFWTGGVVQGNGVDTVPAMLTPGEMVLTQSHQSNLMSFLDGAHSAGSYGNDMSSNSGGAITVNVVGKIRGSDIDVSGKRGGRKNKYFE